MIFFQRLYYQLRSNFKLLIYKRFYDLPELEAMQPSALLMRVCGGSRQTVNKVIHRLHESFVIPLQINHLSCNYAFSLE